MNLHYNVSSMTVRRLCSGSIVLFMTLNTTFIPFNSVFLHYQIHLSSHSFILISSMSLVISPTQLPMFLSLSLVLGFSLGVLGTQLIGAAQSCICLPERGAVHLEHRYKCTHIHIQTVRGNGTPKAQTTEHVSTHKHTLRTQQ